MRQAPTPTEKWEGTDCQPLCAASLPNYFVTLTCTLQRLCCTVLAAHAMDGMHCLLALLGCAPCMIIRGVEGWLGLMSASRVRRNKSSS